MAAIDPTAPFLESDADPIAFVRPKMNAHSIDLMVSGARCAGCISKIENGLTEMEGVTFARLNLSSGRLALEWTGSAGRIRDYIDRLKALGYPASPYVDNDSDRTRSNEESQLVRAMAVAGFATANVMLLSIAVWAGVADMDGVTRDFLHWVSAAIVLPSVSYAGRPFFASAWGALRHRQVNMDVPISLAVLLACGLSIYELVRGDGHTYFDAAAMLLFFLLIGRFLDSRLRARAGAAARGLAAMQAASANRIDGSGHVRAIPARDVQPGDRLLIAAGERVPVDARIETGESELDAALVTGETRPASVGPGARIHSGMINLSAPLTVFAEARSTDSFLSRITRLVEAGQQSRSRYVRLADRAARLYVPLVHGLAALTVIGWLVATGDVRPAFVNAIAVLIITCPCALGLAVPAVQVVATGRLFRAGILVKSGDALERLSEADVAVFDKTGTLTAGRPRLLNAGTLPDGALEKAAHLARTSHHPISRAIADAAGMGDTAKSVTEQAGGGLEGRVDGQLVRLGSARWTGVDLAEAAGSEAWLKIGDGEPIRLCFADEPRRDAADALQSLRARGMKLVLLSGDHQGAVDLMADRLGIADRRSGLTPQDKIAHIEALRAEGHSVLMVGDGLNDAPALAAAHVSISPACASDISQAAADMVLQRDRLMAIPEALEVARAARRRVIENFGLAATYNAIAVPLAVAGFVTPLVAAIAMSASSLLVTLNALRLARR